MAITRRDFIKTSAIVSGAGMFVHSPWKGYHPCKDSPWSQTKNGVCGLDDDFYAKSGGIFMPSAHYEEMFPE